MFGGKSYVPVAFEAEGFEWAGEGSLPRPKIRISNVNKILLASVISFGLAATDYCCDLGGYNIAVYPAITNQLAS